MESLISRATSAIQVTRVGSWLPEFHADRRLVNLAKHHLSATLVFKRLADLCDKRVA